MKKMELLFILGLTSCTSIKIPVSESATYKAPDINATSQEYQIGENGYLIGDVLGLENVNKDSLRTKRIFVTKNERQLEIRLNHNGKDITRSFKYKTVDKELKCKTKKEVGGLVPIVWHIQSDSNSFCYDSDDNLIIYHHHGGGVFLVLFPFGGASTGQMRGIFQLVVE